MNEADDSESDDGKQNVELKLNFPGGLTVDFPRETLRNVTNNKAIPYAYALLQGLNFEHYMRKLTIILGRNTSNRSTADVHLGCDRNISHEHARIAYNQETGMYELTCLGRNPVILNGDELSDGMRTNIPNRSFVEIGDISFYFLLPQPTIGFLKSLNKPPATDDLSTEYVEDSSRATDNTQPEEMFTDSKPTLSYASLIFGILEDSKLPAMTFPEICDHLCQKYPYFRQSSCVRWKATVRQTLSTSRCFIKMAQRNGLAQWSANPEFSGKRKRNSNQHMATEQPPKMPNRSKRPAMHSSDPNQPTITKQILQQHPQPQNTPTGRD